MSDPCVHHWLCEPGLSNVPARCKKCGITRTFVGVPLDDWMTTGINPRGTNTADMSRMRASRARGAVKGAIKTGEKYA